VNAAGKRLIALADTAQFWLAVFLLAVTFIFAYSYINNREAVSANRELIAKQQLQLTQLCETIRVIDVLTVQLLKLDEVALNQGNVPPWAITYFRSRVAFLELAHQEFSGTRGCGPVE
jgi:hypothetical protein